MMLSSLLSESLATRAQSAAPFAPSASSRQSASDIADIQTMDDVEAHYAEGSVGFYPDMPLGVVVRQPVRDWLNAGFATDCCRG